MEIDNLLEGIQKPARYIGKEHNSVTKNWEKTPVKVCLSYPDIYEIGMSYLGTKILYHLLNDRPDILCERVFSPWPDMEKKLKDSGVSLFSLESRKALNEFDIVGFSVGYELTFTNILNILDLGKIPLRSKDRTDKDPIVIAGGPCVFNPLPLKDFVDIFFIGEAEDTILEFLNFYKSEKINKTGRSKILEKASRLEGIYIPSLREKNTGLKIKKSIVKDFENSFYPTRQIVPFIQTVHDRVALEIMRGCPNNCRFCQARRIYSPVRIKSRKKLIELAEASLKNTGYEELSFLSLSTSNYPGILGLIGELNKKFSEKSIKISVPSLRVEDTSGKLPDFIALNKKAGLTFAPEAGSDALRERLNKKIDINKLFEAAENAFKAGWRRIKLYFMIGLPGETEEDLRQIADISYNLCNLKKKVDGKKADITLSINNFIPKAHTQFERLGIEKRESLREKRDYLKNVIRDRKIKVDFQDMDISFLEAALSRGDKLLGEIIFNAWRKGARLDSWREHLRIDIWQEAFKNEGTSLDEIAMRQYDENASLPWGFIETA